MKEPIEELPVAGCLSSIVRDSRTGFAIVAAPPGSGKTTLVAPALLDDLPSSQQVLLVQPRRLAARAVARQIARLRKTEVGELVGYQVRFDRQASAATRLLVVTPGILLRRWIDQTELDEVSAVVLDEFHERTMEIDLLLGLLLRLQETVRPDLRIVLMSATLDTDELTRRWPACRVIRSEGRQFPVTIHYERHRELRPLSERIVEQVVRAFDETAGHILVFLPGVAEIRRCYHALADFAARRSCDVMMLYGDLPAAEQDRAIEANSQRKIILATNIAETSLTIPGVTAVVDSGLVRQVTVHPATGLPRSDIVPVSVAAADQRAGRAGRTVAGHCWRLWSLAEQRTLAAAPLPEVLCGDLCSGMLQLIHCGENPHADFPWLTPPLASAVERSLELLQRLGALDPTSRLTPIGEQLVRIPAHPRLARLLLAGAVGGVLTETALAAALLSERDPFRAALNQRGAPMDAHASRSRSDLWDRVQQLQAFCEMKPTSMREMPIDSSAARQVIRVAEQWQRLEWPSPHATTIDRETSFRQALLAAFPDRLARLRTGSTDRGVMVGGRGVRLDAASRVRGDELFLCLDLQDETGDARVRSASAVEPEWLTDYELESREELFFHPTRGQVEARQRTYFLDLLLEETPAAIRDISQAAQLLASHARPLLPQLLPRESDPAARFRSRVLWLADARPDLDWPRLDDESIQAALPQICYGLRSLEQLRKIPWLDHFQTLLGHQHLAELDRQAPATWEVPSGNRLTLTYEVGQSPILAVRIQELFGLATTPRIAGGRVPLVLHLLGPNYRPQQITADLASFWQNTYPIVKKELRRRYPKHAWPDDPLRAVPSRSGLARRRPEES